MSTREDLGLEASALALSAVLCIILDACDANPHAEGVIYAAVRLIAASMAPVMNATTHHA